MSYKNRLNDLYHGTLLAFMEIALCGFCTGTEMSKEDENVKQKLSCRVAATTPIQKQQ